MPTPKKIFFSYSKQPEDLELYNKINKHFAAYQGMGLLGIIDRKELFKLAGDEAGINEVLKNSDIAIPLLSIDFVIDEECLRELETAIDNKVKIVPIFLRDFDLDSFNKIDSYKNQILPNNRTPVDGIIHGGRNYDSVFKEIARNVKSIILPEIGKLEIRKTTDGFFYVLAALIVIAGGITSWIVYDRTGDYLILIVTLLMTLVITLISLKNVIFPNKIKILKR